MGNIDLVILQCHQNPRTMHTVSPPGLSETWHKSDLTLAKHLSKPHGWKPSKFFSTNPGQTSSDPYMELETHQCGLWAHTKPSHPCPDRRLQGGLYVCLKTSNENISLRNHSDKGWVGRTFPARKNLCSVIARITSRYCCKELCLQKE